MRRDNKEIKDMEEELILCPICNQEFRQEDGFLAISEVAEFWVCSEQCLMNFEERIKEDEKSDE